jgi:signal transduction histidine kinase
MILPTLRARLLASYLAVLGIALGVIVVALVLILNTRDAPPQATYQKLAAQAVGIDFRTVLGRPTRPLRDWLGGLETRLGDLAVERSVRILLLTLPNNQAIFDSAGVFADGTLINARLEASSIALPTFGEIPPDNFPPGNAPEQMPNLAPPYGRGYIDGIVGSFMQPASAGGGEWLFVGIEAVRLDGQTSALIFAEPRPTQTLQAALEDFGTSLAPLVLQAAVAGIAVALVLAAWMSRGIARPLGALADAAKAMANGDYRTRAPITGAAELRAVAEAFNQMGARVESEQQAQQDFLANVSHDLKTPLTSIQGFSQAIIDGATPDPVKAAAIIYEEAARLNRMVMELTDLTRLQAGRLSMRAAPVDLGALTAAVGQRLAIMARDKGVDLRVEASAMPEIAGDGDRLAQVLTNLISNAIKYTPDGGMIRVCTEARPNDEGRLGVAVSVQDTGIGISPDELPRIFERFYQVDKARGPRRGTGLGLAIVREIVHAHGGAITAQSAGLNQGSTFTVWFPSPHLTTVIRRR